MDFELRDYYDRVKYSSKPIQTSHPFRIGAIARLFGLSIPFWRKARILEIGCAEGGNLIPMAAAAPDGHFLGIDLSPAQIAGAHANLDGLGLRNIEFRAGSITELDASAGPFDYIICHGVYSWVAPEIQDAILAACQRLLSPNGIAYVSYNTLPGWNMIRSVRDLMLFHTASMHDDSGRFGEAKAILDFFARNAAGEESWRRLLNEQSALLSDAEGWYLAHDHLEPHQNPVYLQTFVESAQRHGLAYCGDIDVHAMQPGTFSSELAEKISGLTDIVRREQYIDFLMNRTFRMSLLCRNHSTPIFDVGQTRIMDFHLTCDCPPDFDVESQNWTVPQGRSFSNGAVQIGNVAVQMTLATLHSQGRRPIAARHLIEMTAARFQVAEATIQAALEQIGLSLVFGGRITLFDGDTGEALGVSTHPEAWFLVRQWAVRGREVTNLRHRQVELSQFDQELVQLLDGTRTLDQICRAMMAIARQNSASFRRPDGSNVVLESEQEAFLRALVTETLEQLCSLGLLVG
jgi:methyltransferase-like protein/SAM-dependent methyltransferase